MANDEANADGHLRARAGLRRDRAPLGRPTTTRRRGTRTLWPARAAVLAALLLALLPGVALGAAPGCATSLRALPAPSPAAAPLVFGIYSGGQAGTISGHGRTRPDRPQSRLAALQALRSGHLPFVVHLYAGYTGHLRRDTRLEGVAAEIAQVTSQGMGVELVLTYRPVARRHGTASERLRRDVRGYRTFVRRVVAGVGRNPGVVAIQITNEANLPGQPAASDGDFPGVRDALVQGVATAAGVRDAIGATQLRVGFNWAYVPRAGEGPAFFADLLRRGGEPFRAAVDWVGLDVYPGTWTPLPSHFGGADADRASIVEALRTLRECAMPAGGLGPDVAIHVTENGYPTGPDRSPDAQVRTLQAQVTAVDDYRGTYGVTDYRWFDLRDADSHGGMESQYGLLRDDYRPKPAFAVYRTLIASRGAPPVPAGAVEPRGAGAPPGPTPPSPPSTLVDCLRPGGPSCLGLLPLAVPDRSPAGRPATT